MSHSVLTLPEHDRQRPLAGRLVGVVEDHVVGEEDVHRQQARRGRMPRRGSAPRVPGQDVERAQGGNGPEAEEYRQLTKSQPSVVELERRCDVEVAEEHAWDRDRECYPAYDDGEIDPDGEAQGVEDEERWRTLAD